ncbi:MAG TPA: mechanosensitive ion channel family protein [Steroidobacteraceae bacterium]|nr:mechanosensitive ion channel family protein [Steroidobacteraceae bacterium]
MTHEEKVAPWYNAVDWIQAGSRIVAILAVSVLLVFIARRLISGLEKFTATHALDVESQRRAATVSNVLRKLATVFISAIAILAIFNTLGISILPFLATAGVAGIAIAFGAQSLVKDFFRGFFLLAENQIRQGDVVEIAGKSGLVEDLTLRYVQLRDYEGNVHYVPNGEIAVVTSSSRSYAYAVVDVTIALDQDIAPVIEVMRETGHQLRANSVFKDKILEDLDIAGIESWSERGITLRARFKVRALEQSNVKREYLMRLKHAFDRADIQQPKATVTIVDPRSNAGSKPPEGPPT